MSDYDPNRMDPNRPAMDEARYAGDSGFNWSWIIGGIAAIVVLIVALSFVGRDDRTADSQRPVTTGQSSPAQSAPTPAPRPANPNQ